MGKGSTNWPESGRGAEGTSRGGGIVLSDARRAEVRRLRIGKGFYNWTQSTSSREGTETEGNEEFDPAPSETSGSGTDCKSSRMGSKDICRT